MPAATKQDVTMHRGDSKTLRFTATEDGEAKDLTGMTLRWWCDVPGGPLKKDNANEGGLEITDAEAGIFEVDLEPADTEGVKPDMVSGYRHETEATDAQDRPLTVAEGKMYLKGDLIRDE